MNYLGHIYLSGENEKLLVGNFIGDYVKGRQHENYSSEIKKGILFHRAIDDFTDKNEHWILIKEKLRPIYKRYSGVVSDIFVDHFLAKNWNNFSEIQLDWYSKWVYAIFLKHFEVLPKRVQEFMPFLIQHRRLQSYAKIKGIDMSLRIMSLRTTLPDKTDVAVHFLKEEYSEFETLSILFLQEITRNKNMLLNKI